MSIPAIRMLWDTGKADLECVISGAICLLIGLLMCWSACPSLVGMDMGLLESLMWWAGAVVTATGVAFWARLVENNRQRNGMYRLLLHECSIDAVNIPATLFWRMLCGWRRISYTPELMASFIGLWEDSIQPRGADITFDWMGLFFARRRADEMGIGGVMDAICEGVPVADALA